VDFAPDVEVAGDVVVEVWHHSTIMSGQGRSPR
jgi:hypothetical protein